jgi:hypothetical protein
MYIRIFDDGPRAVGAYSLEWVPAWWIRDRAGWWMNLFSYGRYRTWWVQCVDCGSTYASDSRCKTCGR